MSNKSNFNITKNDIPKTEVSKVSNVQKENEIIAELRKKRIESMTDEEIIEENLKTILDTKSREERKANGRLIAVFVAFLVIFLAIYHAWMRKTAVLAGILVPAGIMLGYGGWVVVLAKRDKRKREIFKKRLEEVAIKNKVDIEKKATANKTKSNEKKIPPTTVHFENEISDKRANLNSCTKSGEPTQIVAVQIEDHRKQRKSREHKSALGSQMLKNSYNRRPSIRQKLFGQNAAENFNRKSKTNGQNEVLVHEKRKKPKRIDTLPLPHIERMASLP